MRDSKDLPFDGVLLIALVGDAPGNEMPYVASLPTMAAGAWFHSKIDRVRRSVDDVYKQAVEFARTEYVSTPIQGCEPRLRSTKHDIAQKMSALIGLPADLIEKNDLRISKNVYMFELAKRVKTCVPAYWTCASQRRWHRGRSAILTIRALGARLMKANGTPVSKGRSILPPSGPVPSPVTGRVSDAGTQISDTGKKYYGINFSANAAWNYDGMANTIKFAADAMKANPHMRMFWATGYYDLTTPSYEARYTLDQDGIPADRLTEAYFAGPHGVYSGRCQFVCGIHDVGSRLHYPADALSIFVKPRGGSDVLHSMAQGFVERDLVRRRAAGLHTR